MRQRMMGRLVTATIAVGLIGGSAFGSPLAIAEPDPAPDPFAPPPGPGPASEAPVDPAAAVEVDQALNCWTQLWIRL